VRKISRGMWALDGLNDVLLLSILPSVVVLAGTTVVLGLHWPAMGAVIGIGALGYVGTAIVLATRVIAPAATLSNALDTRLGGAPSDTIGNNAVVKAFGAEAREDERLARVLSKWRRRTRRTWMIVTWSGTAQLGLLLAFRTAIVATALWL
ncbi:ABC transporter ATP-binding protein, partial [Bacillus amyloliquefaciens]|nr:ABC transporter ATP-binding protein [Bacillus amyloliquefaciens]